MVLAVSIGQGTLVVVEGSPLTAALAVVLLLNPDSYVLARSSVPLEEVTVTVSVVVVVKVRFELPVNGGIVGSVAPSVGPDETGEDGLMVRSVGGNGCPAVVLWRGDPPS